MAPFLLMFSRFHGNPTSLQGRRGAGLTASLAPPSSLSISSPNPPRRCCMGKRTPAPPPQHGGRAGGVYGALRRGSRAVSWGSSRPGRTVARTGTPTGPAVSGRRASAAGSVGVVYTAPIARGPGKVLDRCPDVAKRASSPQRWNVPSTSGIWIPRWCLTWRFRPRVTTVRPSTCLGLLRPACNPIRRSTW